MPNEPQRSASRSASRAERTLEAYFLPTCAWETAQRFLSRLAYEMGEPPRRRASLALCEHAPLITIGRAGSRAHLRGDVEDSIPIRYVDRGGGAWLQTPGQIAVYAVLPMEPPKFGARWLKRGLTETLLGVLLDFQLDGSADSQTGGVTVNGRQIAALGTVVRNGVSGFGATLNVCLPPGRDELYQTNPADPRLHETCLLRERLLPIRPGAVRESIVRNFASAFGFDAYYLCHPPADWQGTKRRHVVRR
jgi:lipoyl(octanoyl) transferase